MSVEVDRRAAVNRDVAKRAPVAVGRELDGLRAGTEREVFGRERVFARPVDLDREGRDEMVVAFEDASAIAAAGVTHDEAEPVPAFLDIDVGVCLLARQAEDRPLVVDHERHIVVHESMQAPVAGLGTRDVEPAVIAELLVQKAARIVHAGVGDDAVVEVVHAALALKGVVAHRRILERPVPAVARCLAAPVRRRAVVAELHLAPVGRVAGGNGERGVAAGDDDGRVRVGKRAGDGAAVLIEAGPVGGVRKRGGGRRGGSAIPCRLHDAGDLRRRHDFVRAGVRVRGELYVAQDAVPDAHLVVLRAGVAVCSVEGVSKVEDGIGNRLDSVRDGHRPRFLQHARRGVASHPPDERRAIALALERGGDVELPSELVRRH